MMIIDNREDESLKNRDWGWPTRVEQLPVGDYLMGNSIVVERKEINDFVKSLDQRLWEQAHDIESEVASEENEISTAVLFIIGSTGDLSRYNMDKRKIDGIYGAISRLITSYGLSVLWFRGESQFFKQMSKLHDKAGTEASKKKPHLTKRRYRDDRINILYGIDGIGYETAVNLLDSENSGFDSIKDMVLASEEDLQEVDGIGPKTAQTIHDAFHGTG